MSVLDSIREALRGRRSASVALGQFGNYRATSYSYDRISSEVYRGNPTGYRCVEAIKNNFSRPNWLIKQPNTTTPLPKDPLLTILNRPDQFMSGTIMQSSIAQDLELNGKSFWVKVGVDELGTGRLTGLRRLPAERVSVIGNQDDELLGFIYADRRGQQLPFLTGQILYLRYPHPDRQHDGMPPALVAVMGAETDSAASKFNYELLANDGGIPGYLSIEGLTEDQFKSWKMSWEAGENPGRMRFIGGKVTHTRVGLSNEDLAYEELRRFAQRDMLTAFGVPRAAVLDSGDITFANADSEREMFIQQTILPKWTLVADEMTLQLGGGQKDVGFDLSTIEELARAERELIERYSKLLDRRVIVVNEFRQLLGKSKVPWGDVPIPGVQPMGMETGGEVGDKPEEPKPEEPEDERMQGGKALEQFFARQAHFFEKRFSNGKKPVGWWDEKRWNDELSDIVGEDEAKRVNLETGLAITQILASQTRLVDAVKLIKAYLVKRAKEIDYASV